MASVSTLSIKFTGDAKQLEDTFTKVGVKANLIASAITATFKAVARSAVNYTRDSISAYDTQAKAETSLLTALKGREDVSERLIRQAQDLQRVTLFGDETTIQAQAFLAQMKLSEDAITRITPLVQDFAAAQNVDLSTAAKLVAKSLGSSTNALSRYGIEIKGAVGSNERLESAVNALSGAFGGQAEAAARAGTGPLRQLQNALGDIQELVGAAVTPALQEAARMITTFAEKVQEVAGGGVLLKLQAALLTAVKTIGLFADAFRNSIGPVIGLYNAAQAVQLVFEGKFGQAAKKAGDAITEMTKPFKNLINLQDSVKSVTETYTTALDQLKNAASNTTPEVRTLGDGIEDTGKKTKVAKDDLLAFIAAQEAATIKLVALAAERERIEKKLAEAKIGPRVQLEDKNFAKPLDTRTPPELITDVAEIDAKTLAIQRQAEALKATAAAMNIAQAAAVTFSNAFTSAQEKGASASKALAVAVVASSKEIIGALIREGVTAAITNALKGPAGKIPILGIALAGLAGGLAQALFNSVIGSIKIPAFGDGGVVYGPTLALIGEKGPEAIVPLGRGGGHSRSEVVIRGVQYGADTYWQNANVGMLGRLVYGPQ